MVELRPGKKSSGDAFSEIVGQEALKEALLAVAVDDGLDGLLVRGEKGTAKSTAVRALADGLPTQQAVADCLYGCSPTDPAAQCADCRERENPPTEQRHVPLVALPLGATRERVVGTLSVADALAGDYEFEPGLLAQAHRGLLYVDEVNLLPDHLVDVLLDAAASGQNRVERDGVSVTHPASFTLVGTMNPEEGELRPQLRDRFALQVEVTGCADIEERVAIVEQALAGGPRDGSADDGIETQVQTARERLPDVSLTDDQLADIAQLCLAADVEGHRGDIALARVSRAFAALAGRTTVLESDIRRGAELALAHRLQSRPFDDAPDADDIVEDFFDDEERGEGDDEQADGRETPDDSGSESGGTDDDPSGDKDSPPEPESGASGETDGESQDSERGDGSEDNHDQQGDEDQPEPETGDTPARAGLGQSDSDTEGESSASAGSATATAGGDERESGDDETPLVPGQSRQTTPDVGEAVDVDLPSGGSSEGDATTEGQRQQETATPDGRGARVRTERASPEEDIDGAATVRAAAKRGEQSVESRDLRKSVRTTQASALVVFAVDASASMRPAMQTAKGTVLELLRDAYQHRDEVAFVTFAGDDAEVLLPPTDSVTLAARHLKDLPTGDRTPLAAGMETAGTVLDRADPDTGVVVLVTDGRETVADSPVDATRTAARGLHTRADDVLVVDAGEDGPAGLVDTICSVTEGRRVSLSALSADRVDAAVGHSRDS